MKKTHFRNRLNLNFGLTFCFFHFLFYIFLIIFLTFFKILLTVFVVHFKFLSDLFIIFCIFLFVPTNFFCDHCLFSITHFLNPLFFILVLLTFSPLLSVFFLSLLRFFKLPSFLIANLDQIHFYLIFLYCYLLILLIFFLSNLDLHHLQIKIIIIIHFNYKNLENYFFVFGILTV